MISRQVSNSCSRHSGKVTNCEDGCKENLLDEVSALHGTDPDKADCLTTRLDSGGRNSLFHISLEQHPAPYHHSPRPP